MKYFLTTILVFSFFTGLCHGNSAYAHTTDHYSMHDDINADAEDLCPQCSNVENQGHSVDCCSNNQPGHSSFAYINNDPTPQKSKTLNPTNYWQDKTKEYCSFSQRERPHDKVRTLHPPNFITGITLKLE